VNMSFQEPDNPVGTVAELFAGVGGFRLGLSKSGWKTVFSNQWEPSTKSQHASDVYVQNFGPSGHTNFDISQVDELPKVNLLVGGFPCQDYSVAKSLNSSKGLEGKKGVLWWEILRLVKQSKPSFIFLENVDRLLKSPSTQRGRDFAIMLKTLGDEGYQVEWRVVSASDYGFPQRRIRVFIVAKLDSDPVENPREYVLTNSTLALALPVSSSVATSSTVLLDQHPAEISAEFNKGQGKSPFLSSGVFSNGVAYSFATTANYSGPRKVLKDVILDTTDVPSEYFIASDKLAEWEFLKGAKSLERMHKASGSIYRYSEGKMSFPDSLLKPSRTILTGEGGQSPSRFKHVIETPRGLRRLTPVELERLNGFPDGWTSLGANNSRMSDIRRAFFMGNALVVGLVERVGEQLAREVQDRLAR
jgi:DNA (cytosine-5)-methyltransferase 1